MAGSSTLLTSMHHHQPPLFNICTRKTLTHAPRALWISSEPARRESMQPPILLSSHLQIQIYSHILAQCPSV
ncbi:hypothetical protein K443DRAFT_679540 [Laccaria amethystina LaAM-08-1]|uniref:Uncharacterized protein n=1 Tax=Laccaria amethystina LaAM-08-1 TaxID=1095629 RepID=A0A0C9XEB8_9AGAR|nr:hypothetical protein K443DRAFT_679540 [Laccaria amethystina LaAM-08-1]